MSQENQQVAGATPEQVAEAYKELSNERDLLIEGAKRVYDTLHPNFHHQILGLSKKGLLRVLTALVDVPIKDFNKRLDPKEMNIYVVADRLLQAKFMLEHLVLAEPNEQNLQETVAPETSETVATEVK